MQPHYWQEACEYLSKKDPILGQIIKANGTKSLKSQGNPFGMLCHAIIGQQVSTAAAESIWRRFTGLFLRKQVKWQNLKGITDEKLKEIGLSKQKIGYIRGIADFFKVNKVTAKYFKQNRSEELLSIKGIGPWTLEMFQIFYLMEPDIFPVKDLGLQKAIKKYYPRNKKDIAEFSKRWQPYRTVATWQLWSSFDTQPIAY